MLLGEVRMSASDLIFIKTERYLHEGIAYVPHLEREDLTPDLSENGEGEEDDHAGTPTLIPTTETDFRGVIGVLHRRVKPWRDPSAAHNHTEGTELLPWYRLMTIADPQYVRGYTIGSWWLKGIDPEKAIEFIKEGIENNPDAFQVYYMLGRIYFEQTRELDPLAEGLQIRELNELARDNFVTAARLGLQERPDDWTPPKTPEEFTEEWDEGREDDLRGAARLGVLLEQKYGDSERALELAREYLIELAPDGVLERRIDELAP